MKEDEDDTDIIDSLTEASRLRLVYSAAKESLLPDPKHKALIEEMRGRQKKKRVRLRVDDGPDAA